MFTFLCPQNRVDEAVAVLSSIRGIKVFPYQENAFQIRIDAEKEIKVYKAIEITGTCSPQQLGIITLELSKRKIAGHNKSSTILFRRVIKR